MTSFAFAQSRFATLSSAALIAVAALTAFPIRIPGTPGGLRSTDLICVAAMVALMVALLVGKRPQRWAIPLGIAAVLSLSWIVVEAFNVYADVGVVRARMVCVRWVLSLPAAYVLAALMRTQRLRATLVAGLVLGFVLALGAIAGDALTFDPSATYTTEPDSDKPVWIDDHYRASGIFSHPNSAAGIVLIAVPLLIGAIEEKLIKRYSIILAILILSTVYALTLTRGPVFVAAVLIGAHLIRPLNRLKIAILLFVVAAVAVLGLVGLQTSNLSSVPVINRLVESSNIQAGAGDRAATGSAAVGIIMTDPLGVGSRYERLLDQATGFIATHNGFLQLSMLAGLPLAVLIGSGLLRRISCFGDSGSRIESWTSLYLVGALMFEDQFFVPTVSILVLWLLCSPRLNSSQNSCVSLSLRSPRL